MSGAAGGRVAPDTRCPRQVEPWFYEITKEVVARRRDTRRVCIIHHVKAYRTFVLCSCVTAYSFLLSTYHMPLVLTQKPNFAMLAPNVCFNMCTSQPVTAASKVQNTRCRQIVKTCSEVIPIRHVLIYFPFEFVDIMTITSSIHSSLLLASYTRPVYIFQLAQFTICVS